jgi:hypothetical protein
MRRTIVSALAAAAALACLAVAPALAGAAQTTDPTYTEPYLVAPAPSKAMSVCWITSAPAQRSYVEYGRACGFGKVERAATYPLTGLKTVDAGGAYTVPLEAYQQVATLSHLQPDTRYFYRVVTSGGGVREVGARYYFHTAPRDGERVRFALLSDLQLKTQITSTVKQVGQRDLDFILYNGDLQNTPYKAGEWFTVPGTTEQDDKRWFNVMQQTGDGCRLLQYVPIYPTPGNHEVDNQAMLTTKALADPTDMTLSIYMQLFRPLYPAQESAFGGKHWYQADYGDMHIVSPSIFRWYAWQPQEAPGWPLYDDIAPGSVQYRWLKRALADAGRRQHTWVTMHWHMLNRGADGWTPYSNPVASLLDPAAVTYPTPDLLYNEVKPLFEKYDVDGVSYGHSHVYERYLVNDVDYIEAASIGNNYRGVNDPYHPSGNVPVVEQNGFRSFLVVSSDRCKGLTAQGIQASVEADGVGFVGRVFDSFTLDPGR